MKLPKEDPGYSEAFVCRTCGATLLPHESGASCPACLVLQALTPALGSEAEDPSFPDAGKQTWAEEFPHLKFGERLECRPGFELFQAVDPDKDDEELWLLVVSAEQVREVGPPRYWTQCYRSLRQLHHPHLVPVLDFGELGRRFFVIFKAPHGARLSRLGDDLPMPVLESLMRQLENALAGARTLGAPLSFRFTDVFVTEDHRAALVPYLETRSERPREEGSAGSQPLGPGKTIGAYTVIDKIGEGGFAEIWLAEQGEPVSRHVAIKVLKAGMDTQRVLARFEAERQTLALLQHPHIARVYDAGCTEAGRPYFVMEWVDGEPITQYCQARSSSLEERLELVIGVCRAVQHAHQKGIIHRDLKPSNLLVSVDEGAPIPKVIDFGISKALDQSVTDHTVFTRDHQTLGTPGYMSPEQMKGGGRAIDSRSDGYSLGVLLYELLTGSTPPALCSHMESPDSIESDTLRPPSAQLARSHREVGGPTGALPRHIPRDLDWIVLKALDPEPDRRYQTPALLAEDLRRFLANEPVDAGPPTRIYQMQKFVRRYRVMVMSAAAVMIALGIGLALAWRSYLTAEEERARAVDAEAETQREAEVSAAVNAFLTQDLLAQADPYRTARASEANPDITLREAVDRAAAAVEERFADKPPILAWLHFTLADTYRGLSRYEEAEHHARRAAAICDEYYGPEHRKTIAAQSMVAKAVTDRSRYEEGLALHEGVLATKRKVLGEEDASTLRSRWQIANIHDTLGDHERAEAEFRELLAVQERVLQPEHSDTFSTRNSLAKALIRQDLPAKRAEAIELARETLALKSACCEEDTSAVAIAEHFLAGVLSDAGRHREAEVLKRRVLERYRALFGERHDMTLSMLNNLAVTLSGLGQRQEAVESFRRVVALQEELLGTDHMDTLSSKHNLGSTLLEEGEYAAAIPILEEVIETGARVLGPTHPILLRTQAFVGNCHFYLGRLDEAIEIYARVVSASREVFGEKHPTSILRAHRLAFLLEKAEGRHESVTVWKEVLAGAEQTYGEEVVKFASSLIKYAEALRANGKRSEANVQFRRVDSLYRDGEAVTHAEVEEVARLFKELTGQDIDVPYREIQEEEKRKQVEEDEVLSGMPDGSGRPSASSD